MNSGNYEVVNANINPVFRNTVDGDAVFFTSYSNQSILLGTVTNNSAPSMVDISASNVSINGDISIVTAESFSVGGLQISKKTVSGEAHNSSGIVVCAPVNSTSNSVQLLLTSGESNFRFLNSNNVDVAKISQTGMITAVRGITGTPAFSVVRTNTSNIPSKTRTSLMFESKEYDTNNLYNLANAGKFQPNIEGYYQLNWSIVTDAIANSEELFTWLNRNGTNYLWGGNFQTSASHFNCSQGGAIVYLNGTTDYVDLAVFSQSATTFVWTPSTYYPSRFSGYLIRGK